jgi:hypothetical protein
MMVLLERREMIDGRFEGSLSDLTRGTARQLRGHVILGDILFASLEKSDLEAKSEDLKSERKMSSQRR